MEAWLAIVRASSTSAGEKEFAHACANDKEQREQLLTCDQWQDHKGAHFPAHELAKRSKLGLRGRRGP